LLDAGNSPAQLARQCVRYLRNCVIAKIANIGVDGAGADGVAGELLQISADEQRRAARSASLFSEEELTRFLQVMLRTFDELGYRQEQRFHFELGLLKLVHLRRLLPVEEVLSQFPTSGGTGQSGPKTPATTPPAAKNVTAASVASAAPIAITKPAFSPFEADKSRRRFDEPTASSAPVAVSAPTRVETQASVMPVRVPETASVAIAEPSVIAVAAEMLGMGSVAPEVLEPEAVPTAIQSSALQSEDAQSAEELQRAAVEALTNAKGQDSAADALDDAEWTVNGNEVRVQTGVSKTMLPMVVNPEAEKIVKAALRDAGVGALKLVLLPGSAAAAAAKKPRAAKSGSAQAKALEHPVVQQAQKLFQAEIRTVIDLRDND